MEAPHLLQKRTPCAFFLPHLGQAASSSDAPQLLENFPVPATNHWPFEILFPAISSLPCRIILHGKDLIAYSLTRMSAKKRLLISSNEEAF